VSLAHRAGAALFWLVCTQGAALAQPDANAPPAAPAALESPAAAAPERVIVNAGGAEQRLFDAPFAASSLDAATLREAGPMVNLSEALSRVPGLVANNRSNYAQDVQLSSRGFGARASFGVRGLRLLADGIPASGPDGQGQVSHFDLSGAQRVEVVRGPFSALYGASSGGVIALVSTSPREREASAQVDAGSFGQRQLRLGLAAPLSGGHSLRLGVSRFEIEGFRPQSQAQREAANLRWAWEAGDQRLVLSFNHLHQPAQDPLGLTRALIDANPRQTLPNALPQAAPGEPDRFDTRKDTRQQQASLHWRQRFAPGAHAAAGLRETALNVYGGERAVTQWQAIPVATQFNAANPALTARHPGGVIDFDRRYAGIDARAVWRYAWGDVQALNLVAGFSHDRSDENRRGFENFIGSGSAQQLGVTGALRRDERNALRASDVFVQADLSLAREWGLSLGWRGGRIAYRSTDRFISAQNPDDSGARKDRFSNPVASLHWRPAPGWKLYASLGRGFEAPTFGELAYRPDGGPGLNLGLQPQGSEQLELGAKWRDASGALALDLAVFEARTANEIGVASNRGGRASFRNVGRTLRQGAEIEARWQATPAWRALLAATVLDARYRDAFTVCRGLPCITPDLPVAAGNRIAGTQSGSVYGELAWKPNSAISLGVEARHIGRTPVNDVNSDFAAAYQTLALRASWQVPLPASAGRWSVQARIDNLGNTGAAGSVIVNEANGRFFEPLPPRAFWLALRWQPAL
jgi:iron complex outermembrane recepter protein